MKVGHDAEMPKSACLGCGRLLDRATCVGDDAKPKSGDFTVCLNCGHIMAYDGDGKLRDMTNDEATMIAGDKRVLAIQYARGRLKGAGNE